MYRRSPFRKPTPETIAALLLSASLLFVAASAHAASGAAEVTPRTGDSIGWYTVRPGDTLTGITVHFLGDASLWPENQRLNPQIRDPRHLQPGSRIRVIIARQLPKRNALMNRVARRVEAKPDPEPWSAAKTGDLLKENDGVRTYARSSAELLLDDGSHVVMTENSLLFLKEMAQTGAARSRDTIEIVDGQIDLASDAKKKNTADIEVIVSSASIRQRVTQKHPVSSRSRKTADARAQVMVYAGSTAVAAEGQTVNVPSGMGTQVEKGKAPEKPEKLLAAPTLVSPADGATTDGRGFAWKGVERAATYTVEVFRDAAATQLVERATEIRGTSWQPAATLPLDDLYWRATAVAASGLDGYPSRVRRIRGSAGVRGSVVDDPRASGSDGETSPLSGVRVTAYRDDGNGLPDDGDVRAGEATTGSDGTFGFGLPAGTYWVAVDSTSIAPRALTAGARGDWTWAEQTFGPAGALCGDAPQPAMRSDAGPCVGGRWPSRSDAPSRLSTSKHVARVVVSAEGTPPLTFGFSFDVVTNVEDGAEAAGGQRSVQGSLRQFFRNANAIAGVDSLRFIPAVPPTGSGDRKWWSIRCTAPLPSLTDSGTAIVGTAFDAAAPSQQLGPADPEKAAPALEIVAAGDGDALVLEADTRLRDLAVNSAGTAVRATAPLSATSVWIGLHPDGSAAAGGRNGIVAESGAVQLTWLRFAGRSQTSVRIGEQAVLSATRLEIAAGDAASGPAIAIDSTQASIDDSSIEGGGAQGIVFGPASGNAKVTNVRIGHCSDGLVIRGASSANRVQKVTFRDISGTAVLLEAAAGGVPLRNRVTQCEFTNVATLIGSASPQVPPGECTTLDGSPNRGIAPPLITSFERVPRTLLALYGRACSGTTVEIYEGLAGDRNDARFVQASAPAYDGTFTLLVAKYDENTRMFVTSTDVNGNTSQFAVSPPPKLGK